MASQGPRYPTNASYVTTDAATVPYDDDDWVSITNIMDAGANNASITSNTFDTNDYSFLATATHFGFTIPTDATSIDGIVVETGAYATGASRASWEMLQLLDVSGPIGSNKAASTVLPATAITNQSFGGAADTWSASPTVSMVNSVDFGIQFAVQQHTDNADVFLDYVRITVYYTPAVVPKPGKALRVSPTPMPPWRWASYYSGG